ncbi:MAG: hypothetical protein ACXVH3_26285, partial [Solirubrobacteraceae bacterium]
MFKDLGDDYFTRRQDPERRARRLVAQLEDLGYNRDPQVSDAIAAYHLTSPRRFSAALRAAFGCPAATQPVSHPSEHSRQREPGG